MTDKRVPKCQATYASVVCVVIKGEEQDQRGHRYPVVPDMDDLHRRIHGWMNQHSIYPAFSGPMGGGSWQGYFWPKDAERFVAWLREQPELADAGALYEMRMP